MSIKYMFRTAAILIAILSGCIGTPAQNQRPAPMPSSDLGRANLNRVSASAAEIKVVLLKDPGLMVELKRWVAKDATDHGQILRDEDMTDDAIFDRLTADIQFRSTATLLVQRYGYLVPKLNPDSDAGKEHELLVQERVKWAAQHAEEGRAKAHARKEEALEKARACEEQDEQLCPDLQRSSRPSPRAGYEQGQDQDNGTGDLPSRSNPTYPDLTSPSPGTTGPLERAQLMQTSGDGSEISQLSGGELLGSGGSPGGMMLPGMTPDLMQQMGGGTTGLSLGAGASAGTRSGGNLELQSALLGLSANDSGSDAPTFDVLEANPMSNSAGSPPFRNSPDGAGQPFSESGKRKETLQPAAMIRQPSPYNDIPSLYEMYVQAVPRPAMPRRFGVDVFENRRRNSRVIPMDLPAGPDYVVGPGDGLSFDLWGSVSRRFTRTVDREGRVSLPEVGPVQVSGRSLADVQENVQQILRTQFRDVSADVSLARLRTVRVYEVGDVANPGAYDVSSLSTPLNALFSAGGPTSRGSLRILKHYRGNQLVQEVDVYDLLLHGVKGNIARLENGDSVLVPPIGPQVTIEGMVRRPAIYELKDEKNLASALELAGGLLPTAALRHIEVERTMAHEKKTMLSFDISEADAQELGDVTKKLESFEIKDGDRIRVFPIAPYNQDAIYLEGHVIRPGRYSYRSEMRVTDVVASYKDLLPEPATQYAEIIRLNQPDYHPSVESFDLADALANPEQAPMLRPMDTIRVYSRFDFENPPVVSVWGDVRTPGTFQTAGQIRLIDAVHMAGGLGPDAQTGDAQVFRYLPDGKLRIFSVSLSGAMRGEASANIMLEPRDRLLIHRNPDAVEPATVNVEGEVGKPGRYPLTTNMTVGELLKVGGGLKASADAQTADLTRYEYDGNTLTGHHEAISISAALAGDPRSNPTLHHGDVLTVRQLPDWNDLGALVTIKGEVNHPGSYGIRPGERLSSALERAGGFQSGAYPYGAILQRAQVRELETKQRDETILRVKDQQNLIEAMPEADLRQKQVKEAALQQYRTTLTQLSANPPVGRVDIKISSNVAEWKNTTNDVQVRAGDMLIIPKAPSYVMVTGQVFNPTAVSYRPGKSAKWYLSQSGGPTQMANKKAIFVIRADGSVIGSKDSPWSGSSLGAVLHPGDTVVVPEKAIGPGVNWQNVFAAAQVASAIASAVFIAVRY
ncbi:MAG TPA: SLBB domain-containing protein [Candidatus Dormibacteraeota bacterium]|nr:SLBB domain-containing protein [Candidatus Dormibacteraeota bacterium]